MPLLSDNFFYYDYAGGTYYNVKLCWFFNAPEDISALVWTDGVKIIWHLHGSNNEDGEFCEHLGYHERVPASPELLDYFQRQRYWQNLHRACKTNAERERVYDDFRTQN